MELWGRGPAALCILLAFVVPCAVFFVAVVQLGNLRRALEAQGFRVTLLRSEPPSAAPSRSS